jgi:hypothetical protein
MSRAVSCVRAVLTLVLAAAAASSMSAHSQESMAGTSRPRLAGLEPGTFEVLRQAVPVRIVFVGYSPEQLNMTDFKAWLPATYKPVVRYPQYYGLQGRDTGLLFEFRYSFEFKGPQFTDRFFGALTSMGRTGRRTAFQQLYNDQDHNILDVPDEVLYLDAPSVEAWLQRNDGGHHDRGYAVYFVNWYGRPDFRFHVYGKTDEPDPDTGHNFGRLNDSRRMTAWGGSSSRIWFLDLSAGPEAWTGSWNVDDEDLDGDGVYDSRITPIWEYAEAGYALPEWLGNDLGVVTRFVAINLLFTSSPLYDPMGTAPGAGGGKVAHVAMLEDDGDAGRSGLEYLDTAFMRARLRELQPYYSWRVGKSVTDPIDAPAKAALDTFRTFWTGEFMPGCWQGYGAPLAQLFCFFFENEATYFPSYRPDDYVAKMAAFNASTRIGFLGMADDNWTDGTQSFTYVFNDPELRDAGFGFTSTGVHEVGHHLGLSHPHDGYDSEWSAELGRPFDYGATGPFYFVWAGDESDTTMNYLFTSKGFGQFSRDNAHRWETAGYLNWSNALADAVLVHPEASRVMPLVGAADLLVVYGKAQFRNWNYLESATALRRAYQLLLTAAERIGASSTAIAQARTPLPDPRHHIVCIPRFLKQ